MYSGGCGAGPGGSTPPGAAGAGVGDLTPHQTAALALGRHRRTAGTIDRGHRYPVGDDVVAWLMAGGLWCGTRSRAENEITSATMLSMRSRMRWLKIAASGL